MSNVASNFIRLYPNIIACNILYIDLKAFYNKLKGLGRMETRIENGITIISTGDAKGGKKNKNGYTGIHFDKRSQKHRAEINYKRKKYHLGYSTNIEDLIAIRKEAEFHVKNGQFIDWYTSRKGRWNEKRD